MRSPTPSEGLLADEYALEMMRAYWLAGQHRRRVVKEVFFRKAPFRGRLALAVGINQVAEYLTQLRLSEEDLEYIASLGFEPEFVEHLRGLRFTGDMHAVTEGTFVFPGEPIITLVGPIEELTYVEARILNIVNPQTLVATKAFRVVEAAQGDPVLEMGLRRAQGGDASIYHSRASYIAGVAATSNLEAGRLFGVPARGTHAHALVMLGGDEKEAFRLWAQSQVKLGRAPTFLLDTYDSLRSGLPNAIAVAQEMGIRIGAVRLDSGDLAYLSKKCRQVLDDAGFKDAKIIASGDLDEYVIRDLKLQKAPIDMWGVGTNMVVAADQPALGGVYKLAAVEENGTWSPRIKVSENPEKVTHPGGPKQLIRFRSRETGYYLADLLMLPDEPLPKPDEPFLIFDPVHTWKRTCLRNFTVENLLVTYVRGGKRALPEQSPAEVTAAARARVNTQRERFYEEIQRLTNPADYKVDLSEPLWKLKMQMLDARGRQ
ncbi:nicotinate phosphoribosyltransferase [Symbiobacterium terraclitae]|uniref:Nicotinate phosphoribosyltransferase n=1 Tax=Symbiobacterium terraclitae TaxID=557451 RepID=A0ABS4JWF1_9FIRM|nr:nicotinate phosphoribosyltransferase [Symbiobacterium terraclitae]MBP2019305.1 nicotinate phosphoribosyltransferase [Symbiobacterium terraclitae]